MYQIFTVNGYERLPAVSNRSVFELNDPNLANAAQVGVCGFDVN